MAWLVIAVSAAVLAVTGYAASSERASGQAFASAQTPKRSVIPLLPVVPSSATESDYPPAVRARIERRNRTLVTLARRASREPRSEANGCEHTGRTGTGSSLGPPAPRVKSRILGHQIEVVVSFVTLPASPACRPMSVVVVAYSGAKGSSTYNNASGERRFLVTGRSGRVVVDVPWYGAPPYHVIVETLTILGLVGRRIERALACPGTRDPVAGCLAGYRPPLHAMPMPKPVLRSRGISRAQLAASFRHVLATYALPSSVRDVGCRSLGACEATLFDPAFPRRPYRVRYSIAGQQVSGCWLGWHDGVRGELPYDDAPRGPYRLVGCANWLP
jgi:hypothetical protein